MLGASADTFLLGTTVAAATVLSVLFAAQSSVLADRVPNAIVRGVYIASWGAVGILLWRQRPESRLGPLFIALSWIYGLTALMAFQDSTAYSVGRLATAVVNVFVVYVFLAFPGGRLRDWESRAVATVAALGTLVLWAPVALGSTFFPVGGILARCAHACPPNAFKSFDLASGAAQGLSRAASIVTGVALVVAAAVMLTRLAHASALRRRTYALPALCLAWGGAAAALSAVLRQMGGNTPAALTIGWIAAPAFAAAPYALLLGQGRSRLRAESAMRDTTARIAHHEPQADVRAALSEALDDPNLEIAYWAPEIGGYVDGDGHRFELRDVAPSSVTEIAGDGRPVAAIVHDPALDDTPGLVEAAADAALLALDNSRLEAELHGAIDELRASRARIVQASEAERKRLEQDLHDSAQQRLVALRVRLGLVEDRAAELSEELRSTIASLGEETQEAIDSLRAIAQGIYPPLLAGSGLGRALRAEALHMPLPVHVAAAEVGRSSPETEAAVYFCCLEALQNAAKHAGADVRITIELHRHEGDLEFSVRDGGSGFDVAATPGTGLTNMRDRIGAVGGRLKIASTPGAGTSVAGAVPWARRDFT